MNEERESRTSQYMRRYGVTRRTVEGIGVKCLALMTEDARAVMFSTLKWEGEKHAFRRPTGVPTSAIAPGGVCVAATITDEMWAKAFELMLAPDRPLKREVFAEPKMPIERMMQLAKRLKGAA